MPNIKFNYLYRDSANYKRFNSTVFKNDIVVSLTELETLIKSKLIYGEWFYAEEWKLPGIFLNSFDYKIDPTWHEFESIEYTNEDPNTILTVEEFMKVLKSL